MNPADVLAPIFNALGLPDPLPADPMPILSAWFDEESRRGKTPNPNAMVLSSVGEGGQPQARVVLCKALDPASASLMFFTNYDGPKAQQINADPRVHCTFLWDHAQRQARLIGTAERASRAESEAYFQSRPLLSRLGAWASHQSRPLDSRAQLVDQARAVMDRFGVKPHEVLTGKSSAVIPCPENWGGYRVRLTSVELWVGVMGRLHDRAIWTRVRAPDVTSIAWSATRLQP